jgi:hypothetical protein
MPRAARIKIILTQKERDDNIARLLEVMVDVYAFVLEAEPVKKLESHKQILASMVQQTTECAYFLREYATNTSFSMSVFAHQTAKLDHFPHSQANASLKTSFQVPMTRSSSTRTSSGSSRWHFKRGPS